MTSYIGLIRKDTHSDFGVDISDFPGCVNVPGSRRGEGSRGELIEVNRQQSALQDVAI